MITNFEINTYSLTDEEKVYIPLIIKGMSNKTKNNPIKSDAICKALKDNFGINMTGARLRKITNFIRSEGILPIIATSNGYYCSYDQDEIRNQIQSLYERADAIRHSADGLKRFLQ